MTPHEQAIADIKRLLDLLDVLQVRVESSGKEDSPVNSPTWFDAVDRAHEAVNFLKLSGLSNDGSTDIRLSTSTGENLDLDAIAKKADILIDGVKKDDFEKWAAKDEMRSKESIPERLGKDIAIAFADWIAGCCYNQMMCSEGNYVNWADGNVIIAENTEKLFDLYLSSKAKQP